MKTIQIKIMTAAVAVALGLMSNAVYADSSQKDPAQIKAFMQKKDAQREKLYKDLNLTDDQKKSLEENKNKRRGEMKALFEEIRAKRTLISQELQSEQLNMDRVNTIQAELKQLHARMLDDRLQGILEVRKILTPEQFKKFLANMDERKDRSKRHWGKSDGVEDK